MSTKIAYYLIGALSVLQPELLSVEDILALPNPAPDARIAYGDGPLQFGDLRLPPGGGPHPVAVVIHGGCWRSRYDVAHIGSFSEALSRAGVATWTIEYRRVGDAGGGWPGTFEDVAAAADELRALAGHYALDLDRVVAVGHSAGGHLALWLTGRATLSPQSPLRAENPLSLKGAVSLAGVGDLRQALKEGVCDDMVAQLLGGTPEEVGERYREASPISLLPLGTPQHILHGARDPIVPASLARDYAERARRSGDRVELTLLEDAGHFELIAPSTDAWPEVREAVTRMLRD